MRQVHEIQPAARALFGAPRSHVCGQEMLSYKGGIGIQKERHKNQVSLCPDAAQEAVLLRYCGIAAQAYEDYRSLRKGHPGRFDGMGYALRATSRGGRFAGVPVWLVLRMAFVASMDGTWAGGDAGLFLHIGRPRLFPYSLCRNTR